MEQVRKQHLCLLKNNAMGILVLNFHTSRGKPIYQDEYSIQAFK